MQEFVSQLQEKAWHVSPGMSHIKRYLGTGLHFALEDVQGDQGALPMQTPPGPGQHPHGIGLIPRSMCGSSRNGSGVAHLPLQPLASLPTLPQVGRVICS